MIGGSRDGRPETVATQVRITGRVQRVGYRHWTEARAKELGLLGYVRNLTDGSVEALLIGPPHDVARMLTLCEEGPLDAEVETVESGPPDPAQRLDLQAFRRSPTGDPGSPAR